jgi:hypothetical protein
MSVKRIPKEYGHGIKKVPKNIHHLNLVSGMTWGHAVFCWPLRHEQYLGLEPRGSTQEVQLGFSREGKLETIWGFQASPVDHL